MALNVEPDRAEVVRMRPGVVRQECADLWRQFQPAGADDRQVVIAEGCVYVLDQYVDLSLNEPTGGSLQPMGGDTRAA